MAFLFQAYLITFWFILLVGAMMMRSSAELDQSRFGIQTQQSFWMAETGIDELTYRLKVNPPSLSAANQCIAPLLRLTNWTASAAYDFLGMAPFSDGTFNPATTRGYVAQTCLRPAGEYQLAAIGVGGARAAEVATTVTNVPNQNLQFNHAVLATGTITAQHSTVDSTQSGPYGSVLLWDLMNNISPGPTMFQSKGHLATLAQGDPAPASCTGTTSSDDDVVVAGGTTTCVGGRFVNLLDTSTVHGNVYVSPHVANASDAVYISTTSTTGQTTSLVQDVTLPPQPVAPPDGATDLGDQLILTGTTKSLESGIYKANSLVLRTDANHVSSALYTTGSVDLYVRGNVTQSGGQLYGQQGQITTGFNPYTNTSSTTTQYYADPRSLRIIVLPGAAGTATPQVNLSGGITGAVIYATGNIPINVAQHHTLVGAAIGKQVTIADSSVYYDQNLTGMRFTVNSTSPVAINKLFQLKRVPLDQFTTQFLVGQLAWNPWVGTPQQNSVWVWLPAYGGWWSWDAYQSGRYMGPPPPPPPKGGGPG